MYGNSVRREGLADGLNHCEQVQEQLKKFLEQIVSQHMPLRVTRRNGTDFVVMSAEDWERDQETLYALQK
jgi:antitoxin YefM